MAKKKRGIDPEIATQRILRQQLKAFRKKFGRDPHEDEPLFFDPDESVPTPLSEEKLRVEKLKVLSHFPPHIAYAYAKTGRLLIEEQLEHYPPEAIEEWKAAVDEYFELEAKGKKQ